jgi:hypothetical protein
MLSISLYIAQNWNIYYLFSVAAALEILSLVGFREDVIYDNLGKEDAYLVLKRNDPGLLWLAKSTLESSRA